MSSSRLPGKVLLPLAGKPMIWHIVQRAINCAFVDSVIVATSDHPSDDVLADYCLSTDIPFYRGNLHNVLSRFTHILNDSEYDYYVRVTGDCPLIDPFYIDHQISLLRKYDADLIWPTFDAPILCGQSVHSTRSLFLISQRSSLTEDLEHVGSPFLIKNLDLFRVVGLSLPAMYTKPHFRVTVDEALDYDLLSALYDDLWDDTIISLPSALQWLYDHPEFSRLNSRVLSSTINHSLSSFKRTTSPTFCAFSKWQFFPS